MAATKIKYGIQDRLYIGNLDSKRDWGFAKDYVEAMWLMLQQEKPDDYVIATGETHSVREFIELVFKELGIEIIWQGEGAEEVGIDSRTGKIIVEVDPRYYRPTEVELLIGDSSKARKKLGWEPKVRLEELVKMMVQSDEEEILKNYSAEKLAASQEIGEDLVESVESKLNISSL